MKIEFLLGILAALYVLIVYLAIEFAPPDPVYAETWKEARRIVKECNGTAHIEETLSGFEVTCYED